MEKIELCKRKDLKDKQPKHFLIENIDLVALQNNGKISVLYGRCLHRGALLADGYVEGGNLVCGVHNWDYRIDSGISEYNHDDLTTFNHEIYQLTGISYAGVHHM